MNDVKLWMLNIQLETANTFAIQSDTEEERKVWSDEAKRILKVIATTQAKLVA